jgi:hypothetical protein
MPKLRLPTRATRVGCFSAVEPGNPCTRAVSGRLSEHTASRSRAVAPPPSASSFSKLRPRSWQGCSGSTTRPHVVPLAVTASAGTFYLGWICPRCLAADTEGSLLDVLGVYATPEDAEQDLLSEEYHASLEPPDLEVDAVPSWA